MNEIWKSILGYEGIYEISNLGNVKSLSKIVGKNTRGEVILKPAIDRKGYLFVSLTKNKISKCCRIHRLIAIAFIENSFNKPQIDHIDGNPLNNSVDNLKWSTQKENLNNPIFKKRNSISHLGQRPVNCKKVYKVDEDNNVVHVYQSLREASEITGIDKRKIVKTYKTNFFSLLIK